MIFRRRALESDYVVAHAVTLLRQVSTGEVPFDRTMRVSTAEENAKEKITKRIPYNVRTLEKLQAQNRGMVDLSSLLELLPHLQEGPLRLVPLSQARGDFCPRSGNFKKWETAICRILSFAPKVGIPPNLVR